MANVLDIRRRIRSVTNTRQITKAMKMVSAAKLRRAQERAVTTRPYSQMLTSVLKSLVTRAEMFDPATGQPWHPLLLRREEKTILLIVVSGDKGLAGAFNTNINKAAAKFLNFKSSRNVDLECVGRKGRDFLRRRYPAAPVQTPGLDQVIEVMEQPDAPTARSASVQITGEHVGVLGKLGYAQARALAENVIDRYSRGEIDAVYLLFNEFKSVIAQRLVVERVLPVARIGEADVAMAQEATEEERKQRIEAAKAAGVGLRAPDTSAIDAEAAQFGSSSVDYIYEQSPADLFRSLLPKYVADQIFHGLIESVAAEHAARMTAMEAATSNASDMIESLTLIMNRARQAKITKEIIEIVSGAAAL